MKKKNSKKWALVLVLLLVVSIGYAALASNLKINGTSGVKSATWDVYWNNVQVTQGSVATTQGNQARITDQAKTQVEYSVTLNEPGDFYEFTVDAVNNGTIDAMIAANGIVNGVYSDSTYETPATLPDAIKYSVTYADGTAIAPKHLLAKKTNGVATTETYKVRIEYRNDNDVDPEDLEEVTDQTYYFKFSVNYVQADSTAIDKNASAIRRVYTQNEGQITPGDVIGIGETEDFYVISSNSEKTVLLAKYNLLVGNKYDNYGNSLIGQIQDTDSGYGLQSDEVKGYGGETFKGTIAFSSTTYWDTGTWQNPNLLSPYNANGASYDGNPYPYVYDSNSTIYQYINGENGYVNKLKAMGAPSTITGRLLSFEEADAAKSIKDNGTSIIVNEYLSYWLGSSEGPKYIYAVQTLLDNDPIESSITTFQIDSIYIGVRPVIEIPTSEIR